MYEELEPISCTKGNMIQILSGIKKVGSFFVAQNDLSWLALLSLKPEGIITNINEWEDFRKSKFFQYHILSTVQEDLIFKFDDSLRFNSLGLASANYEALANLLSEQQIKDAFCLFGIGGGLFDHHKGYKCAGKGTCTRSQHDICTGNCAPLPLDFYENIFDIDLLEIIRTTLEI